MKAYTSDSAIIFVHIPKTAGVTLNHIINKEYPLKQVVSLYEADAKKVSNDFNSFTYQNYQNIKLIRGHIPFGLHKYIQQPSTYITVMRRPVDRIISHYYHAKENYTHKHHQLVTKQRMSLLDYATSNLSYDLDNCQTRLISGQLHLPIGKCTRETLELAKANIDKYFSLVGISNRFDETLMLLNRIFGWKLHYYGVKNRSHSKSNVVTSSDISVIQQYNELDMELFRYAEERFDMQIKKFKPEFSSELIRFQHANNQYKKIYAVFDTIVNIARKTKHSLISASR